VEAIAGALRRERMLLLSLGPATNIAATLRKHPGLKSRILAVVAIAGGTETDYFELGRSRVFHAHDQNFRRDIPAFETLLNAGVPVVLIPYDTTTRIGITSSDLQRLARAGPGPGWLARTSAGWLEHWSGLSKTDSFVPFDAVAVAFAAWPEQFRVARRPVQIRRPVSHAPEQFLVASPAFTRGWVVSYVDDVSPEMRALLLDGL
jgi:pyrimidine-specific ribonucleoside hydrolase